MIRPIIAIVGRPNVGKSTLFNRLVGRRQALVRDTPGVTRDRLYGRVSFERWQATVIDTGGFDPVVGRAADRGRPPSGAHRGRGGGSRRIRRRHAGRSPPRSTSRSRGSSGAAGVPSCWRRTRSTPPPRRARMADLYRLGFGDPLPVSAEHGRGVAELLEMLRERCAGAARCLRRGPRPRCTSRSWDARTSASRRS